MLNKVEYKTLYSYPHLGASEKELWDRFIRKYPDAYDSVVYDLALGHGVDLPKDAVGNLVNNLHYLSRYKIDIVGFRGDEVDIIEVKPRAGATALGQILHYINLYKGYIDPEATPNGVLLTDALRSDMPITAQEHDIKIIII